MPRFILLYVFGAVVVASSQVALSVGIHHDHLASLRYILQSGAGLVIGTAMAISGLIGLAERYQHSARQLSSLLHRKTLGEELQLAVRSDEQLQSQNQHFWQAYRNAGLSLALFLAGLLGISVMLGESSFFLYMAGLSAGVAVLGIIGVLVGLQGLRSARLCQKSAESDAKLLASQPDYTAEPPPPKPKPPAKIHWSINRNRRHSDARALARRRSFASR